MLADAAAQLSQAYDWQAGGWGKAPKFPQPMSIEFLLLRAAAGDQKASEISTHALHAMAQGGMYDLTLASRFGPLDNEATNLYEWARYYIIGASFWGVDWYQTIYWFGQLMDLGLTSLADSSCMTVMQRFRDAHLELSNLYLLSGDWCTANDYMTIYISYPSARLEEVQPTASYVYEQCQIFGTVTPTSEIPIESTTDVTPTPAE